MADIRVYELAKQLGVDNKAVKKVLSDNGIEVKSHMSSVTESEVQIVKKALGVGLDKVEEKPADKGNEVAEKKNVKPEEQKKKPEEKKSHITQVYNPQNSGANNNNPKNENKNGGQSKKNRNDNQKNQNSQDNNGRNNQNGQNGQNNGKKNNRNNQVNNGKNNGQNNQNNNKKNNQNNNFDNRNNNQKNKNNNNNQKPQQPVQVKEEETIKEIILPEVLTIKELADKMKIQPSALVKKLFLQGQIVTINQEIDFETAQEIALEYDIIAEMEEKVDIIEELLREDEEDESKLVKRPPVVCVMGHVDHGKTSLLDAIRQTNVIAKEAGGITQHIGAYTVKANGEQITFLDTPGHEAFTAMRMRGAQSTDIAILVVAADDGVMPQTVEAINHAKAAGISIIVAVNKIDKPSANIDKVKQELAEYELVAEDWGGDTIFVPVSAHTKEGIDTLLEMILLEAEVCELKANPNRKARGLVIEAQLDISFMHSSNFSSVSFCLSVSVPSSSSRFRATNFSNSFNLLSPRVHCSKGDMLPYQSSSSVFIRTSAYRNGDRFPEFSLGNTVTVLFHFFYCYQGLTDNFKLKRRLLINTCLVGRSEEHRLEDLAHHSIFVAVVQFFDRYLCHVCYLLGFW